jgi:uncharacterized protein YabN with tetrapyrrole methylase and pyrophosphatase domain
MITVKMIFYDDSGNQIVSNIPLDLIDDIEELPLYELREMNIFGPLDIIYMPQPEYSEKPLYN